MLNPLIKQVPVVGQAYGFTKTATFNIPSAKFHPQMGRFKFS
jgi:hypothetical protein